MADKIFSQHPTIYKYDRLWIGTVLGLLVPTLGIAIVYFISLYYHIKNGEQAISITDLIHSVRTITQMSRFMSVGCILNLGVFFLFINRDYFNIARGVIFATMIISLPIMVMIIRSWFI